MVMLDQGTMEMEKKITRKWVSHYCSTQSILLVGEGDFSFSLSLATSFGSASNIVATSLDSQDSLFKKYSKARSNLESLRAMEATILHGVDATRMKQHTDLKMRRFDRIVFNFPHAGFKGKEDHLKVIKLHRQLVLGFFQNASRMLRPYGEVHVTHKMKQPFIKWNLEELGFKCHLVVSELAHFNKDDYPLYNHKRGDGEDCDQPFPMGECSTYKFRICLSAMKDRSYNGSSDPILPASAPHLEHDETGLISNLEISQIPQANIDFGISLPSLGVRSYGKYWDEVPGRRWLDENYVGEVPGRRWSDENYVGEVPGRRWSNENYMGEVLGRRSLHEHYVGEVPGRKLLDGNYVGELPGRRWLHENYAGEVPGRTLLGENYVVLPGRKWLDENYVCEVPERRWLDGGEMPGRRWLHENYMVEVPGRRWLDGNYTCEVPERRLLVGHYVGEVPGRRCLYENYWGEVPERIWIDGSYVGEVPGRRCVGENFLGEVPGRKCLDYIGYPERLHAQSLVR